MIEPEGYDFPGGFPHGKPMSAKQEARLRRKAARQARRAAEGNRRRAYASVDDLDRYIEETEESEELPCDFQAAPTQPAETTQAIVSLT